MVNPRIAIALVLVGALALGGVVLAANSGGDEKPVAAPNQFAGATMPADARAPDFQLRDEQGEQVSMRALRGQPVVVTFLYSHCQDTCPITAQTIRGALDDLGHDVPALAISVDPPNDTPASARKFLAEQRTGGRIRFEWSDGKGGGFILTGEYLDLEPFRRIVHVDRRDGWAWPIAADETGWAIALGNDLVEVQRAADS